MLNKYINNRGKVRIPLFLISIISVLLLNSCNYLDVVPTEFYTEDDLLSDIMQAEKENAALFQDLPVDFDPTSGSNGMNVSAASDEAYHNWNQSNARLYDGGSWNAATNPLGNFNACYQNIHVAYHFLKNIDNVPIKDNNKYDLYVNFLIPVYKAEAKFMIAFNYFELFKKFGAVPLIKDCYSINDNDKILNTPRSSTDEVVEFITSLCDSAAAKLPETYEAQYFGHITKGAALALKAKALLYAASPLYNGGEIDGVPVSVDGSTIKSTILATTNTDGKKLFNTEYDKEKWKKAADAAKTVIDMAERGVYSLNTNQQSLFYQRDFSEYIFWKQLGGSSTYEKTLIPNGADYGGTGALSTPQEMIDSYEMKNGLPINDPKSGYKETGYVDTTMNVYRNNAWTKVKAHIRSMYFNRDPRFYTNQFFNGMPYLGRNVITEYITTLGNNQDGWGKSGQNTKTGYYVQKWVAPTQNIKGKPVTSYRNFPLIRLADVYLWYAEALNEYNGPSKEVYDAINKIRNRVGMPSLPLRDNDKTKNGLRERIQNERKIEMAYEGHRFYDTRRWLIAHTSKCNTVTGMDISAAGESFYKRTVVCNRVFKINFYVMPIPISETSIAPQLVQNYGW